MTFSLSENNALFIPTALKHNCNIAIVLDIPLTKKKDNRKKYLVDVPKDFTINNIKLKTIDGDINDARFFDSKNKFKGTFIGLIEHEVEYKVDKNKNCNIDIVMKNKTDNNVIFTDNGIIQNQYVVIKDILSFTIYSSLEW